MLMPHFPVPPAWPLFAVVAAVTAAAPQDGAAPGINPQWVIVVLMTAVTYFLRSADKTNTKNHDDHREQIKALGDGQGEIGERLATIEQWIKSQDQSHGRVRDERADGTYGSTI